MNNSDNYVFWFLVGSQDLYGASTLQKVKLQSKKIVDFLNTSTNLPFKIKLKAIMTNQRAITNTIKEANYNDNVIGVITWMHTFSPAKNWIRGTQLLQKPLLHFATQFLNHIPYSNIDFTYMNTNQSAHGDREYGFINARLHKNNKIIYGDWRSKEVQQEIHDWMNVALTYKKTFETHIVCFGGIMKHVAVTDGDKIEAQIKLGWVIDYESVSVLQKYVNSISRSAINSEFKKLSHCYEFNYTNNSVDFFNKQVMYQLKLFLGIKKYLETNNYHAFTTNFEDLANLKQLPGLAVQLLEKSGYGFAAEGDWKTAGLNYIFKILTHNKRTAFIEDYTLDYKKHNGIILGSHMLEVNPKLAGTAPVVEVHSLNIGKKEDPARLVFSGQEGSAVCISLIDLGDHFELISYAVNCYADLPDTPKLPVAKQFWAPKGGLTVSAKKWIQHGGGHHIIISFDIKEEQINDLCRMLQIKYCNLDNI